MNTNVTKQILFICVSVSLFQGMTMRAAVKDWIRHKKEQVKTGVQRAAAKVRKTTERVVAPLRRKTVQTQEAVQRKISEARRATGDLLATLQQNKNCLISGTCPVEQKRKLRSLAIKIGVAIGVIAAAAAAATAAAYVVSKRGGEEMERRERVALFRELPFAEEETLPGTEEPVQQVGGKGARNIREVADDFGVDYAVNDKVQNLFLRAVHGGGMGFVREYYDLVKRNVIQAGIAVAQEVRRTITDVAKKKPYEDVIRMLGAFLSRYNPRQQQANVQMIEGTEEDNVDEVREAVCGEPKPTKNAQEFSRWRAVQRKYGAIIDFLKNPRCPAPAG